MITQTEDAWIEITSGRKFYPMDPKPENIQIGDIARALSTKVRYTGHLKKGRHYSIAEHSVWVMRNVKLLDIARLHDGLEVFPFKDLQDLQKWGLLHDAAETYLPDVPRPIKPYMYFIEQLEENSLVEYSTGEATFAPFKDVETKILKAVAKTFDLTPDHIPEPVKQVDMAMIMAERYQVMPNPTQKWGPYYNVTWIDQVIEFWDPVEAEEIFLEEYGRLWDE